MEVYRWILWILEGQESLGADNRPTSEGGDSMKGRFEDSLKQLREDIEREGRNDRNNHSGDADYKRIQPLESELLSNEVRNEII